MANPARSTPPLALAHALPAFDRSPTSELETDPALVGMNAAEWSTATPRQRVAPAPVDVFGRSWACTIRLTGVEVSGEHAALRWTGAGKAGSTGRRC